MLCGACRQPRNLDAEDGENAEKTILRDLRVLRVSSLLPREAKTNLRNVCALANVRPLTGSIPSAEMGPAHRLSD